MFEVVAILVISFIVREAKTIDLKECYDPKHDFYPYLSTRTSYQFVRGNITRPSSDYEPLQVWMMSRHGARYPAFNVIKKVLSLGDVRDQIVKNHERGAGQLCETDLNKLRDWQLDSNVSLDTADTLAPQGKKDLLALAQRLRDLFPEILKSKNSDHYLFTSTGRDSASYSLETFATGLVGSSKGLGLEKAYMNDTILLSHGNCPAWIDAFVAERVYAERDKFTAGPEVQQVLKDLSRRLGFSDNLDFDTARSMYEVCRLETAWNPDRLSTWCTLFTKDELIVLEYREDLDYYYCCGPGNQMNAKLNCASVKDMFQHFEQIENGNVTNEPKGLFYFGHTTNIQSLLSSLKISREPTPLLATTFKSAKNRTYRASLMGPFNANLLAVLYKCTDVNSPYKVMFYLNENLVQMEGCENGICDWKFLKREFGPGISHCSLDFCYDELPKDSILRNQNISIYEWFNYGFKSSAHKQTHNLMVAILLVLSCILQHCF